MKTCYLTVALVAALGTFVPARSEAAQTLVEQIRAETARFANVWTAWKEGYRPVPCVSGAAGGSMGIHYVNAVYLNGDDGIVIGRPEALMYEPQIDGELELVGVEYITFSGPAAIAGQLFDYHGAPNRYGLDPFYELHVWTRRANPRGTFAGMNPDVTCDHAASARIRPNAPR